MENKATKNTRQGRYRLLTTLSILGILFVCMVQLFAHSSTPKTPLQKQPAAAAGNREKSLAAFEKVYSVLLSPRCVNCHRAGEVPLQGDDSRLHAMLPQRGKEGKGMLTMKCANCHQPENTAGKHSPPGSPHWQLPPADMKMVFQGKSPRELALQLVDPKQNGHKDLKALLAHADDELVRWGWNPGEGRSLPPLSHQEFKTAWITWLKNGAHAPAK